ncbi:DUF1043 domain-containing protein [Vreelandella rituensis]|uniref:DUF1043 family protein n=1 Tax=Vreelandella rituensis TaxID=2282306 RepID=A0A368TVZ3_9GAMM|nr:DUF1043 family protein [Halomonas rituensis]RCV88506.1 DUF1043 family protein [Halomonas rituensis]
MEANTQLTFAIIGIVIGIVIGVVGYRLFSKSHRDIQKMRQKLLERDHQLAELKGGMGENLLSIQQRLDNIRHEADQLENQLNDDASRWQLEGISSHLDVPGQDAHSQATNLTPGEKPPSVPRDYADGSSGTLSEDFGLRDNQQAPQPPRY